MKLRSAVILLGLALFSCSTGGSDDDGLFFVPPRWANQQRVPTASHLRAVRFAGLTQGVIAGHDTSLYRTDDGGLSWIQMEHTPFNRGGDIVGLDFLGSEFAAVGVTKDLSNNDVGRFWTCGDALNWVTPDAEGALAPFVGVDLTSDQLNPNVNLTWALREDWTIRISNSVGAFDERSNTDLPAPGGDKATAIDMLFSGPGYIVGENGRIFETQDRSANWIDRSIADPNDFHLRDVHCLEAGVVFVCGEGSTLVWTENGGALSQIPGGPAGEVFRAVHFIHAFQSASTGWVVGDNGLIRKITGSYSGGNWTWSWSAPLTSNTAEDLYDVYFIDANTGYAVGDNGAVVKTTNGGSSWTNMTNGSTDHINAVCFEPTGQIGVAVGDNGKVYKTLNGGSFWSEVDLGAMNWTGVSIPPGNFNVAYICGPNGAIRRNLNLTTTNTWEAASDADIPNVTLRGIHFPQSGDVGFAVGDAGTILWTNTGTGLFDWDTPFNAVPSSNYQAVTSNLRGGGLNLYAAGSDGVIAESSLTNYALTWSLLASGVPASWGSGETVTAIQSPIPDMLLAGLDDGAGQRLHRRLAGSWLLGASQPSPTPPTPAGLAWVGQSLGWWVSDKIYTTENGANTGVPDWKVSPTHTKSTFRGIWMNQAGTTGYVVGTNGTILKTLTGGK